MWAVSLTHAMLLSSYYGCCFLHAGHFMCGASLTRPFLTSFSREFLLHATCLPFEASSQNTATYASCTARNFFLVLISTLLVHSPSLLSLSYILPYSFSHLHFCPCTNFYLIGSFTYTFVLVLNFTIFIQSPILYWFMHLRFCSCPIFYHIGSFTFSFVFILIFT